MNSEWFGGGDRVKSQKNFKLTLFGKFMQITIWEMNERCAFIYLGGGAVKNGSVGFGGSFWGFRILFNDSQRCLVLYFNVNFSNVSGNDRCTSR